MSTWEERMSQRAGGMNAQDRARHGGYTLGSADHARRRREEYEQRKRDQGFVLIGGTEVAWEGGTRRIGGKWFKPEPEEGPDYCRECCTWDSEEGIYKVICFETYMGMRCRFGHDHHDGEAWMA
jgi:hypothetical protein